MAARTLLTMGAAKILTLFLGWFALLAAGAPPLTPATTVSEYLGELNITLENHYVTTEDGYILEIAIPFRSIRYTTDQQWKIIFTRKIPSMGTKYSYPQLQRNHPRMFTQGVSIENLEPPPASAPICAGGCTGAGLSSSLSDEGGRPGRRDMGRDAGRARVRALA